MELSAFQLVGVVVGLFFCYNAYIQHKKGFFKTMEFAFWVCVWGGLVVLSVVSGLFYPLTTTHVFQYRLIDIVLVSSITLSFMVSFAIYKQNRILKKKLDVMVREAAKED